MLACPAVWPTGYTAVAIEKKGAPEKLLDAIVGGLAQIVTATVDEARRAHPVHHAVLILRKEKKKKKGRKESESDQ